MKPQSPPRSSPHSPHVSAEQLRYADWLDFGTRVGFVLLIATFCVYASGVLAPHVPLADLPGVWALPIDRYLAATGGPSGWGWLALVSRGDYLNFIGVAFLGGITIACYLRVLPMLVARRDGWFAAIAVLELVVLAAAASGLIGGGH